MGAQNKWYNRAGLNNDPIAQTFRVLPEHCPDADGIYMSSVDLFFQSKDSKYGVNVEIREVKNGYPTKKALAASKKHLLSKEVATSSNAAIPTRVIFPGPVFLKAGLQYALCVRPDGGSPNYRIWFSQKGENDVVSGNPINSSWGDGVLFISASDTWEPRLDADLKFRIYKAIFNAKKTGTVTLTNRDLEFFTISNLSGTFRNDEHVYKVPGSFAAGNVAVTKGTSTITGTSTTFTSDYAAGDTIVVRQTSNTDIADVLTVKSIESDTSLTVLGAPRVGFAIGKAAKTPVGRVQRVFANTTATQVTLKDSSAANGSYFANNDTIKGTISFANASITSVDNKVVNSFQPFIYKTEPSGSTMVMNYKISSSANLNVQNSHQVIQGVSNKVVDYEGAVFSKSNEVVGGGTKSLVITQTLKTTNENISPISDPEVSLIQSYQNLINNDYTNEKSFGIGNATSKYLSKTVQLAAGLDADDLNVYVSGYRPANTNIKAYCMVTSLDDSDKLIDKQWTEMAISPEQENLFSSNDSANDFREFKYTIPSIPTIDGSNKQAGTANTASGNTVVLGANNSQYTAEDLIVVTDGIKNNYVLGRVASANATAVVLDTAADKTITDAFHYKVNADEKQSAFKYPQGDGTNKLRYFNSAGVEHETFSYFQVKLVLLSDTTNKVPRIADMRAIALSL